MSGYYSPTGGHPPQQYNQPQQQWAGQQYGAPPNQYQQPPPQQQWGAPPQPYPQQFQQGPPQGQNFHPAPPPGAFAQQGPPQGYGQGYQPPPPPQQFHQMPPQPAAMQQPYQQATMASPGYNNEIAQGDASGDVQSIMKAMSGLRKDHSTIIGILSKADPARMALIRQTYAQRNGGASLETKVDGMRGHYGDTLVQLVRGPLIADAHNVNRAIKGMGTKEDQLNDVLIGRSNADMRAIKQTYQQIFKRTMESDVEGDLSLKTKTMFQLIMHASRTEESYPYNPAENARDAEALHHATKGPSISTNQEQVFAILTQRSDNQIRAIAQEYQRKYGKNLEDTIRSSFSGHMEDALLLALGRATDRAKTDAYGLEDSMKGLGTKDDLLVQRLVRIHWDRANRDQVKRAYEHFFKKDLIKRVRGETSGDYRDALVACLT